MTQIKMTNTCGGLCDLTNPPPSAPKKCCSECDSKLKSTIPLFFTITLNPKFNKYKPKEQHSRFHAPLKSKFSKAKYIYVYELTNDVNIHAHGIVFEYEPVFDPVKHWKAKFKTTKNKHQPFGYTDWQIPKNYNNIVDYLRKDIVSTSSLLGVSKNAIIQTNLDIEELNVLGVILE